MECERRYRVNYTPLMPRESLVIGIGTALVGVFGLLRREWLLAETPKGRFLVTSMGLQKARSVVMFLCGVLLIFGSLLATGVLQPLRW